MKNLSLACAILLSFGSSADAYSVPDPFAEVVASIDDLEFAPSDGSLPVSPLGTFNFLIRDIPFSRPDFDFRLEVDTVATANGGFPYNFSINDGRPDYSTNYFVFSTSSVSAVAGGGSLTTTLAFELSITEETRNTLAQLPFGTDFSFEMTDGTYEQTMKLLDADGVEEESYTMTGTTSGVLVGTIYSTEDVPPSAVPLPATALSMLGGVVGLSLIGRRCRKPLNGL